LPYALTNNAFNFGVLYLVGDIFELNF
jgi:hypothetical protein